MMTKKILFLLTFLLTTIGGGNLFAADETFAVSCTSGGSTINGTDWGSGNVTLSSATASVGLTIGGGSDNWNLGSNIITGKATSASLTFQANKNGLLVINLTKDDGGNKYLTIKRNGSEQEVKSVVVNGTTISYNSSKHGYNIEPTSCSIVVNIDAEAGVSYTIDFSASDFKDWSFSSFTFDLETIDNIYSDSYPYTWDFTVATAKWTKSKSQMNSLGWNFADTDVPADGIHDEARPNAEALNTTYDIDIIKGLHFTTPDAGSLCLDWKNHVLWMNGTLTIPSLKVGQTITFDSNADVVGDANVGSTTGTVFTVTTAGDVSFTVNTHVRSIAITKNDLTDFSFDLGQTYYGKSTPSSGKIAGVFIGRTNTFKYKLGRDQILRTTMRVSPDAETLVGKTLDVNENISQFTMSSYDESVLGISGTACRSAANKVTYWDIPVNGCGTTNLTYRFAGSDAYNAEDYVQMITIEKDDPVLAFDSDFITKNTEDAAFTNALKLNGLLLPFTDDRAGEVKATYESKNTSVATVNSSTGEVMIVAPGVATIEATVNATDWNNKATKSYTLVVNPTSGTTPTISWNDIVAGSTQNVAYNQSLSYSATASAGTVKYRIADTSIAELDKDIPGKVTGKGIGYTTVTAYIEPTASTNYVETIYTVNVTKAGELKSFKFIPNNGKVNNGKNITPKLVFPTIPANGVTSLKVTQIQVTEREGSPVSETLIDDAISNCDIIRVDASDDLRNNWELDGVNKVFKVNVTINGKKVGKARITVTFESDYYNTANATYDVEVTEAGTTNFSWTEGSGSPEYYTYAGDFMMLPALTGNSNGNYNYSSGAKNSSSYTEGGVSHSALHAYEYERNWDGSKFNIKWNNKNIKIGEGFPDFAIVTDGISSPGTASVFFGRGEGSNHPDTLMVFCETAGDVKLRAYDPQDHTKYCDATIHILPINNIEGTNAPATTVTSSMTYPYTWDFTTNFDMSVVGETDRYWTPIKDNSGNPTGDYTNGYGFFNLDWADTNKNPNTVDRFYKYFIAGASSSNTGYMHLFNGAMLQLKGSSSWANKMDRMRIYAYDSENKKGRLGFIGGPHNVKLFLPESSKRPSSYKIIVKASGAGGTVNVNADENKNQSLTAEAKIVTFDSSEITTGSDNSIILGFADARVYWIAMSTEEKTFNYPKKSNSNLRYAAAAFSYPEDLDLSKSNEVNGATAYYASSFTTANNKDAGAFADDETQYAVVMKPLTSLGKNYVNANTGMLLKYNEVTGITADTKIPFYMIANPRNVATYNAEPTIDGSENKNFLVGTGATTPTIGRTTKIDETIYTNFMMSAAYKYYTDITKPSTAQGDYRFDRDWSFYPVMNSGAVAAQKSYLQIPGDLYVNRNGEIVEMPSSSRRTAGESAEAPATKAALSIVFDDDPLTGQGTTGISTVATETTIDSDAWYTLQGVRVETPTKGGIYIHKGRKIVVK